MSYTFDTHLHNYAVWTAARATSRDFTSTANIKKAIEDSLLKDFNKNVVCETEKDFEDFHKKCANQLINNLSAYNATYGIAAKIISIYLKTSIILPNQGNGNKCNLIHPPIDRILLQNIYKKHQIPSLKNLSWTKLDEKQYWDLIKELREKFTLNWTLEEFWSPERE